MAKRELLIIALFGAAGLLAYQWLAPPVAESPGRPSLARWLERARSNGRGPAVATVVREGRLTATPDTSIVRIAGTSTVVVRGEDREDLVYQLTVEANGGDPEDARTVADGARLRADHAGRVLSLTVDGPAGGRLAGTLVLQVPKRLTVQVSGARSTAVSGVEHVTLDRVLGETRLRAIAGDVTGSHRNGELSVSEAASVALNLVESTAEFTDIRNQLRLTARRGESRVEGGTAAVEIDSAGSHVRVESTAGAVRVFGMGGDVDVLHPREGVHVDVRAAPVTLTIDRPVSATIFSSERLIRVTIAPGVVVGLDLRATEGGSVDATSLGLTPEITSDSAQLQTLEPNGATLAIRNRRGTIEIAQAK